MRLSDLQSKDVINITDGKKVGNIIDILIENNGQMTTLIVEKSKFFATKLFGVVNKLIFFSLSANNAGTTPRIFGYSLSNESASCSIFSFPTRVFSKFNAISASR